MLDILEDILYTRLIESDTFETFYEKFKEGLHLTIKDMGEQINIRQHVEGLYKPNPIMSVLTGDFIAEGKSVLNGGVRYRFDSTNIYGSTNTVNALYTIKQFYEGKFKDLSKEVFLERFMNNFEGQEEVYTICKDSCKFGNYNEEINILTTEVMSFVFNEWKSWYVIEEMSNLCLLWLLGQIGLVMVMPDGRKSGEPLADSAGSMQGTDIEGHTSV